MCRRGDWEGQWVIERSWNMGSWMSFFFLELEELALLHETAVGLRISETPRTRREICC